MCKNALIANIVIPPLAESYSYKIQPESNLQTGFRVEASFNHRKATGYIVNTIPEKTWNKQIKLKILTEHINNHYCFSKEQLEFFKWMAGYYQESLANIIDTAIPSYSPPKAIQYIRLIAQNHNLKGKLQKQVTEFLAKYPEGIDRHTLLENFPTAASSLKTLEKKNVLQITYNASYDLASETRTKASWVKSQVILNAEQQQSLDKVNLCIDENKFQPFLLYGVTGSGKTEVYLDACNKALKKGKSVLLIVPEIALTPQLVDRFAGRLEEPFAVLHSNLSRHKRWSYWQGLLSGEIRAAIGVRSAVFAPLKNLGLIIVDEEHDSSFKQSDNLRYHARDLAVKRAQLNNCPVILGSATPTLESLYNVQRKRYAFLRLSKKFNENKKNVIKTINLKKCKKKDFASKNITEYLASEIKKRLDQKEQVFILYNRRGFAAHLQCKKCHESIECKFCSITLTYYQKNDILLCHYCGFKTSVPATCLHCKDLETIPKPTKWVQHGAGTEKVHLELAELFPQARISRLDRGTVHTESDYRAILDAVRNYETDILVGTQMIAKGHDLPNVTLVGVIDCDVGLYFPDFRASEKVFQLLTQVSGRAGRSEKSGLIVFQTYQPEHISIICAKNDDFQSFIDQELSNRKILKYPPFSKLLRIIVSATNEQLPALYLEQLNEQLITFIRTKNLSISVLGPTVAPISKIRRHFRWHIIFKSDQISALHQIMQFFRAEKKKQKKLRIIMDLDPQDML